MKVTFLGTGPMDTVEGTGRNRRMNTSALVEDDRADVLIGFSNQFKQAVSEYAERLSPSDLDGVLLTHGHGDMIGGVNQFRKWLKSNDYDWRENPVDVYCERETWQNLQEEFQKTGHLNPVFIDPSNRFSVAGLSVKPFRVEHSRKPGNYPTVGFRFGNDLTWAEDVASVPSKNTKYFDNVDTVCIDGSMWFGESIYNHFSVGDALRFLADKKIKHVYLVQLGRTYPDWYEAEKKVQSFWKDFGNDADVNLGYDGLVIREGREIMTQHVSVTLKPKDIYSDEDGFARSEFRGTNREEKDKIFVEDVESYNPSDFDNRFLLDDLSLVFSWTASYLEDAESFEYEEDDLLELSKCIWGELSARKLSGEVEYQVVPEDNNEVFSFLWSNCGLNKKDKAVLTLSNDSVEGFRNVFEEEEDGVEEAYDKWDDVVNMTASELREWSTNPCSREASKDPIAVIKRNLRLLETPKAEWGEDEVSDALRTYSFIKRMKPNKPEGDASDGVKGCPTEWAISLLNWAYNPFSDLPEVPEDMEKVDEVELSENVDLDRFINNPLLISDVSDSKLRKVHDLAHNRYNDMKEGDRDFVSLEDVWNLHRLICKEMDRRGMNHDSPMPRLGMFSESSELLEASNGFDDRTVIHDFVSIVGSTLEKSEGNDLDVLLRVSDEEVFVDYLKRAVWAAFKKELEKKGLEKEIDVIGEAPGPHSSYKPVYDLVLVNKNKDVVSYSEKGFVDFPFTPQKPSDNFQYDEQGFLDALDEHGYNYFVEFKADGFHVVVEKFGGEVSVVTEDGTEVKGIPSLKESIKGLHEQDFVVDGELVYEEDDGLASRRYLMPFLEGNDKDSGSDEENVNLFLWDVVSFGQKDLTDVKLDSRKEVMEENLDFGSRVKNIPGEKVSSRDGAENAFKKFVDKDESEGVVAKWTESVYEPGSENSDWLKYRKTQVFYGRVIDKNSTEGGNCNYNYGVDLTSEQVKEVPKDKVVELEDEKVMDLGNTFNTDTCGLSEGDIIEVQVEEVWRHKTGDGVYYSVHKPVFGGEADRESSSDLERLDNIVSALGTEVVEQSFQDIGGEEVGEEDEGGTRSDAAKKFWTENWHEMYNEDGEGDFVFQVHWRGLSKEEASMSHERLLEQGKHSIHGDLRWGVGGGSLAGFTVFEGDAKDVPEDTGSKLIKLAEDKDESEIGKLRGTFKLEQPESWLEVGLDGPLVQEPGEIGATTEKYSKFFALDNGSYELGVMHKHYVELFLDGDELEGRVQIVKAPVGGDERIWMIDFPEDQQPTAEEKSLEEQVEELLESDTDHEFLIWNNPGSEDDPEKIDLSEFESSKYSSVKEMVDEIWS